MFQIVYRWACVLLVSCLAVMAGCASQDVKETKTIASAPAPTTVAGRVILAADSTPLANVSVFLVVAGGSVEDRTIAKSATDANGTFTMQAPLTWDAPGDEEQNPQCYFVFANSPEHGFSFAKILKGDRTDALTVRLVKKELSKVTVKDKDGKPIEGALVFYHGGSITEKDAPDWDNAHRWSSIRKDVGISSGLTDAKGEVRLPGLYDGSVWHASKAGYASGRGGTITLLPAASLHGTVTFPDGKPADGAIVKCNYRTQNSYWEEEARTDAKGQYRFEGAPMPTQTSADDPYAESGYGISVAIPNTAYLTSATTRPTSTDTRFDIQLNRACMITGKVLDDRDNKPLAGIRLSAMWLPKGARVYESKRLKTGPDGGFSVAVPSATRFMLQFEDSPAGDYVLDREWMQTRERNYQYQALDIENVSADKTDIVLPMRLWDVKTLVGTIVDGDGKPVEKANIHLNYRMRPAKTDAQGKFTMSYAPNDRDYDLCAISADSMLAGVVHMTKGSESVQIQLKPTQMRDGIVKTPGGLPAGDLKFYLDLKLNGDSLYTVRQEPRTDNQGKFTARVIPGQQYTIFWSSDNEENRDYEGTSTITIDTANLADGAPITFEAPRYINALMGRIVGPDDNPVAGVKMTIPQGNTLVTQDRRYNNTSVQVASDGSFSLERLADGVLPLKVTAPGYKTATYNVATDEVDAKLVLRPRTEPLLYRAKVIDVGGKPVAGVPVTLIRQEIDGSGKMQRNQEKVTTDAEGIAKFASPTTAPTTQPAKFSRSMAVCNCPEYDLTVAPPVGADEDMDVTLTVKKSSEHWTGKVVDAAGTPIKGATVALTAMRIGSEHVMLNVISPEPEGQAMYQCLTGDAGEFTLERIGREEWVNIDISAPNMKRLASYFQTNESSSLPKTFQMQKGCAIRGRVILKETGQQMTFSPGDSTAAAHVMLLKNGNPIAGVSVKPDGTFQTDEAEPGGTYSVRYVAIGEPYGKWVCTGAPTLTTSEGGTNELVIELVEGIEFAGRFDHIPDGQKFENAHVLATLPNERLYSGACRVKEDGTWRMWLPRAGSYKLTYYLPSADGSVKETSKVDTTVEVSKPVSDFVIDLAAKK